MTRDDNDGSRDGSRLATTLYRFYDADDQLLYIGITSTGPNRWTDHERHRGWWARVARSTTSHFATRVAAMAAERQAIAAENPPFNVRHREPPTARGPRVYRSRGTGTIMYRPDRDRWAVLPRNGFRGWYHFRTEAQARAFLEAALACSDPEIRAALERLLG